MRVVHLSFNDRAGGAARAAYRLHEGLLSAGVDSKMLVLRKTSQDPNVIPIRLNRIERFQRRRMIHHEKPSLRVYPRYDGSPWSSAQISTPVLRHLDALQPDIVHLHWVGDGYLSLRDLGRIEQPIVWTLHDQWAFTGGCHYSGGCSRYQERCGQCPILGSQQANDLSRAILDTKLAQWDSLKLHAVAPSRWLADCARTSAVLQAKAIDVIPNGLDLSRYRPLDRSLARAVFNLPEERRLILFGAYDTDDPRKGFVHLQAALQQLPTDRPYALVTFGRGQPPPDLPFPLFPIEAIDDERLLPLLYTAADVFVAPSVEDNLPNTVAEALACGTPCVAFHIGGLPDMIMHQVNGYLAQPIDSADLAAGIDWVLTDIERYRKLNTQARQSAERVFDLKTVTERYINLYRHY